MKNLISVAISEYDNAYSNLKRAMSLFDNIDIPCNGTVVIKINMCDARLPETGAVTHPLFLDAVLHYLRENFKDLRIYVVESDATVALADEFVKWLGYAPIIQKWDAEFVNLNRIKSINTKIDGRYFKEISIPEIFEKSDYFITIPKPKTNPMSTITCCLKNQFGCLPLVEKNIYHPYLDDVIADVNKAIRPDLCLVDGIIAMGGEWGPAFGHPIPLKSIICSQDPVATDAFCANLMGFNPKRIGHIRKSASSGIGSMKYVVEGDNIEKVDFETSKFRIWLIHRIGTLLMKKARRDFRVKRKNK